MRIECRKWIIHWHCLAALTMVACTWPTTNARAETRIDVSSMLQTGAATVTHSPLDIGTIHNAFDSDASTLARSAGVNPLVLTLEFSHPVTVASCRTRFLAGLNRWRAEAADSLPDLDSASGSHIVLTDWKSGPEQTWSSNAPPAPQACRFLRFSLERLAGDDYVHLTDVEFFRPDPSIILESVYAPFEIRWSSVFGQWYAVEESDDLRGWTLSAFQKASSETATWQTEASPTGARFFRVRTARPEERPRVTKKVLVLNYDPILEAHGGIRLHAHMGWNDPRALNSQYLDDLSADSGGYVQWEVVSFLDLDEWPMKVDGFRYTDETFLEAWHTREFHMPDGLDYARVVEDHNLDRRVREGEIDEVVLWGFPYSGFYESRMVGATAYWCNAPGLVRPGTPLYVMMGLNYERGVAEALHSFGHRVESIMRHVYGSWSSDDQINHAWDRFTRYEKIAPGLAACGNIHFPPNGAADYDYGNQAEVLSEADDWLQYPHLTGAKTMVSADDWGRTHRGFMNWWFTRLPRASGRAADEILHNWWAYAVDFNEFRESR